MNDKSKDPFKKARDTLLKPNSGVCYGGHAIGVPNSCDWGATQAARSAIAELLAATMSPNNTVAAVNVLNDLSTQLPSCPNNTTFHPVSLANPAPQRGPNSAGSFQCIPSKPPRTR